MIRNHECKHGYTVATQILASGLVAADILKGGKLIATLISSAARTVICHDHSDMCPELAEAFASAVMAIDQEREGNK